MKRFSMGNDDDSLDRRLRASRPEPRPDIVEEVASQIRGHGGHRRLSPRPGIAVALTAVLLAAMGATGGLGYAASGAKEAAVKAKNIVAPAPAPKAAAAKPAAAQPSKGQGAANKPAAGKATPAGDQYGKDRETICHRTPSGNAKTLVLPAKAAQAHLDNHHDNHNDNHPDDTPGPCPTS